MKTLLLVLDLAGTFVFALSGALAAVRRRLDVFGVLVLAVAAATSGGVARDLLIGSVPPAAIRDWRYLAAAIGAGVVTFRWAALIEKLQNPVRMFDAAGLALFAVAGTEKALAFGIDPPIAALLGMLTGIGGGMARDLLLAQVPMVLRADLYAVAALAGATVVVVGEGLGQHSLVVVLAGAALCFTLRMLAVRRGWQLPRPPASNEGVRSDDDGRGD